MTEEDVLANVLRKLAAMGLQYALTGSFASAYWGIPRSTHDVDLVVTMVPEQVASLVRTLGPDYYADTEMMVEAIARRSQFNVIHMDAAVKVDFWLVGDSEYDRQRFARRVTPDPARPHLVVLTPEDVILSKLVWMQRGAGGHHLDDIRGILRVQGEALDMEYLRGWAERLGVTETLAAVAGGDG